MTWKLTSMSDSFLNGCPVRIDLPRSLESIHLLDVLISEMLDLLRLDKHIRHQINLAVIEAGTNAIKHGSTAGSNSHIRFEFRAAIDKITIVIRDSGQGVHPTHVENSDLWRSSGRGLQLINAYMDEVKYEVTGVTMVKHIS